MEKTNTTTPDVGKLKDTLKRIGHDYDLLTEKQQKHLLAACGAVTAIFDRENKAHQLMTGNSISIKRIAADMGVTRDTIYNNKVLRDYVEYCASEFSKIDHSSIQNGVAEENSRLRAELAALHARDVEFMETKLQLETALVKIQQLNEQLEMTRNGMGFGVGGASAVGNGSTIAILQKSGEKIISWNVNGLQACIEKGFFSFILASDPDIICLQETRIDPKKAAEFSMNGYNVYWNHAERKGYSGTAIISRIKPIRVLKGMGIDRFDREGRIIVAEYKKYYLVNCYAPASQEGYIRLQYRMDFDDALREYVRFLDATKPVIICGDFNVAHNEIDIKAPFTGSVAGISPEEREKFDELLYTGYDDAFRFLYPDKSGTYSWWPYGDRKRINGIRLDYFLTSESLRPMVTDVTYRTDIVGSDHCPVILELRDSKPHKKHTEEALRLS